MGERIKRFIECLIPVTLCNLQCDYCYVKQLDYRTMKMPEMQYDIETIGKAFAKERWGGICYFSVCGAGETLIPYETVQVSREVLRNGHFLNLTNNGTQNRRIEELMTFPQDYKERMHFSFSLHYLELKKRNLLDAFTENVRMVKKNGCSFLVQLNLYDGYRPYIDEIKDFCLENFGAWPQVAATRKEGGSEPGISIHTASSVTEYRKLGGVFHSDLFDFTMRNFNIPRHEYCYAGDWSFQLNLATGILKRCYFSHYEQNIFDPPDSPIDFTAVGRHCHYPYCINSSHFLSLGTIPGLYDDVTYASLRDRPEAGWYTERMKYFLSSKLEESNTDYRWSKRIKSELYGAVEDVLFYQEGMRGKLKAMLRRNK